MVVVVGSAKGTLTSLSFEDQRHRSQAGTRPEAPHPLGSHLHADLGGEGLQALLLEAEVLLPGGRGGLLQRRGSGGERKRRVP